MWGTCGLTYAAGVASLIVDFAVVRGNGHAVVIELPPPS
jgi:hypothetical protein